MCNQTTAADVYMLTCFDQWKNMKRSMHIYASTQMCIVYAHLHVIILHYIDIICTADTATVVHADIYCCLTDQTIGKTKKIKETKDPSQNHSKTIENNQKNQKNQRSRPLGGLCMALTYYRGNFDFWSYTIHFRRKPTNPAIIYNLVV